MKYISWLLAKVLRYTGLTVCTLAVVIALGYGSNYAFDAFVRTYDNHCLVLDEDARMCIKKSAPP